MGGFLGHVAPTNKLNIAGVGVGGKGRVNLKTMSNENIVALCDVDRKYAQECFNDYPDAKRYRDWGKMVPKALNLGLSRRNKVSGSFFVLSRSCLWK